MCILIIIANELIWFDKHVKSPKVRQLLIVEIYIMAPWQANRTSRETWSPWLKNNFRQKVLKKKVFKSSKRYDRKLPCLDTLIQTRVLPNQGSRSIYVCVFWRFSEFSQNLVCLNHSILRGKLLGIPLILHGKPFGICFIK